MRKRVHYHTECLIVRGVNKERIVRDTSDRVRLISTLTRFAGILDIRIIAYSLTKNQLRVVVASNSERSGELIKRMASSYVRHYFNKKYHRYGNLFTERYMVESTEEAGGLTPLVREVLSQTMHEKNGLNSEFSSFNMTMLSFEEDLDTLPFDFSPIRAICGRESFVSLMSYRDEYYFGRKAYTPSVKFIRRYLSRVCGDRSFYQLSVNLQRYVVRALRFNRIRFELITLLTGLEIDRLRVIAG